MYFLLLFCLSIVSLLNVVNSQQLVNELSPTQELEAELKNNPIDPSSFSRSDQIRITHIKWNALVNFKEQVIEGQVDLAIEKLTETNKLILDTSELTISEVRDKESGQKLKFELSPAVKVFGSKLTVDILSKKHSNVSISYKTSPNATALQWLKPEQTAGKRQPYLFSQCEPIQCRSLLPSQDSPSVKATFEATIRVPKSLVALMSALHEGGGSISADGLTKEYRFKQNVPVQSYLISLVVGDLVSKQIGPRSHVWSEPEMINRSAYEFADTEKMLTTAESIMGPYVWGVYNLLILPPSFAFGGMENPCLTFVTPTILAGDRSLANVIAHEIAHSWTGNLVTNKNWDHFWLNEGFTTFVERKIVGRLSGEPERQFRAIDGLKELKYLVESSGPQNPLTKLVMDVRGVDPNEATTGIPYEKGHTFLYYLEEKLGGPQIFEAFLKEYVNKFKFTSIETKDFKKFLIEYFKDKPQILQTIEWDKWLYSTGMPPIIPNYDDSLAKVCTALAQRWITANESDLSQFTIKDIGSMDSWQIIEFLNQLLAAEPPISSGKVISLTQTYGLRSKNNSEIKQLWIRLGLRSHWKGCVDDAISFVTSQGRAKFLEVIYKALYDWEDTRKLAIDTFKAYSDQYMHYAIITVSAILHLDN